MKAKELIELLRGFKSDDDVLIRGRDWRLSDVQAPQLFTDVIVTRDNGCGYWEEHVLPRSAVLEAVE